MPPAAPGLEEGEQLLAIATVTFRGSLAASWKGWGISATRSRLDAFAAWSEAARAMQFPVGKPEMKLGVTDRRLVVWRPSYFRGRPAEFVGDVPFERIAQVTVYRSGIAASLTILFTDGQFIELEAIRGRRLRDIARHIIEHLR